jgi:glycosyltransferase involved in cell wall biosynthesis
VNRKIKQNNLIAIIDPKQIVMKSGKYTLERHKIYYQKLKERNVNYELKIFFPYTNKEEIFQDGKKYQFMYGIFCPKYFTKTIYVIKLIMLARNQNFNLKFLVAGDPWLAYFNCVLIKYFCQKDILIQTQIHADLGSTKWRHEALKNQFKYMAAKIALKHSDSIRCVSIHQKNKIKLAYKISDEKIFVSGVIFPLPKTLSLEQNLKNQKYKFSVGFFGRLEKDRGIEDFLSIIKRVNDISRNIEVVIAGTGSQKDYLLEELNRIVPNRKINYLGYLDSPELHLFFKQVNLCIFTADHESFGRGMRECLANKVPIWSKPTSGFMDLLDFFKEESDLTNLEQLVDEKDLKIALNRVKNNEMKIDYNQLFRVQSNENLETLIGSWLSDRS